MTFNIITLFPDFFETPLHTGLLGKAIKSKILNINLTDLRSYSEDKFNRCDDYPYGGGSGMVLKAEPIIKAIEDIRTVESKIVLTTPVGNVLKQQSVKKLSKEKDIIILCGNYEGIDQRVIDKYVDYEISIGDYILSGGEFAALIIIDAIVRYIPGFMSNEESLVNESFENHLLEYPHFTRPSVIDDMSVPEVLLSGDHKRIENWRLKKSIEKTKIIRPDLYKKYLLRKDLGD